MLLALIMLLAILISTFEYVSLWKMKARREIYLGAGLLVVGVVLGTLQINNVNIPNPMHLLIILFTPVSAQVDRWLS